MTGNAKGGLTLILVIFILLGGEAFAYDLDKRVHRYTLKNGCVVLLVERHVSPTVSFSIQHRVGAVNEAEGKTGAAHLLEHMMFKGTKRIGSKDARREEKIIRQIAAVGKALDGELMKGERGDARRIERLRKRLKSLQAIHKQWFTGNEIDRLYTEAGAVHSNASTGQDLTTYHVSLPNDAIELWARIESERMWRPVFREFYTERDVIQEERRQRIESDPEGTLSEQFYAAAFTAHPYRRPVIGWPSDIRFLDPDEVESFFRQYYAPNNTVIAVVGAIEHKKTMKLIEKYFGKIPPQGNASHRITEEPAQQGERRVEVAFSANPELIMGWHKPPPPAADDYVFDVIDCILSTGRTSRFYKVLVEEKNIAESIWTSNGMPGSQFPNLFVVFTVPRSPHTVEEVEASIADEIENLKLKPVSHHELEKAKNQIRADYLRRLDSNEGLAGILSYYESLLGDYRYFTTHIDVIEKITPEDIMRVAKTYLRKENRTVTILKKSS